MLDLAGAENISSDVVLGVGDWRSKGCRTGDELGVLGVRNH